MPDVAVSLFAEVLIPDPTVIPEWVQPGSTNHYMIRSGFPRSIITFGNLAFMDGMRLYEQT